MMLLNFSGNRVEDRHLDQLKALGYQIETIHPCDVKPEPVLTIRDAIDSAPACAMEEIAWLLPVRVRDCAFVIPLAEWYANHDRDLTIFCFTLDAKGVNISQW